MHNKGNIYDPQYLWVACVLAVLRVGGVVRLAVGARGDAAKVEEAAELRVGLHAARVGRVIYTAEVRRRTHFALLIPAATRQTSLRITYFG
jgi:hypothetical protein